mmetsp:Transcript_3500/g.11559  ORF Transcript_3500/g.11559 Transcript_3500/m.11559 type:complete len:292 (+) Transcript_3500:367-1242(+)
MVGVLPDGLLQAIHVNGGVVAELPDGHILADPGHGQPVLDLLKTVEGGLLSQGVHEFKVGRTVPEQPVARAEVVQDVGEEVPGPVHEEAPGFVHGHAQLALLGKSQHGVEERRLPQCTCRRAEGLATDIDGENGRAEELEVLLRGAGRALRPRHRAPRAALRPGELQRAVAAAADEALLEDRDALREVLLQVLPRGPAGALRGRHACTVRRLGLREDRGREGGVAADLGGERGPACTRLRMPMLLARGPGCHRASVLHPGERARAVSPPGRALRGQPPTISNPWLCLLWHL